MKITSSGIKNCVIQDKYGKRGVDFIQDMPSLSLPVSISEAPKETKSFALILDDKDAVPVCGKIWIHWLAANIPPFYGLSMKEINENHGEKEVFIEEGASQNHPFFVQGVNSWKDALGVEKASVYGGMAPPDKPHSYDLQVFALDELLDLQNGFTHDELMEKMQNHILATALLQGCYTN